MRNSLKRILLFVLLLISGAAVVVAGLFFVREMQKEKPDALLKKYFSFIEKKDYEGMFRMIDPDLQESLGQEAFIQRNSGIYEGMETENIRLANIKEKDGGGNLTTLTYDLVMDTVAGEISFSGEASFINSRKGYFLLWNDGLILPGLTGTDKVRVSVDKAERGKILDREGRTLAGPGLATSVGIVPGKLQDKAEAVKELALLLDMEEDTILQKLSASWVKEDSFVPVATIPGVSELELLSGAAGEELFKEQQRQEQLLSVPGVMLTDQEIRSYPLGEAASHLIGYVQGVTAEDLEEHKGEGYDAASVIGRSGMELLYEKELKGQNGYAVRILDGYGDIRKIVANVPKTDGQDIRLTIDSELQKSLYQQFQEDSGCSVAMDPYTGQVLALVSTPSYDNNDFILGMGEAQWKALNEDEKKPMYNRFRQIWSPGSVLKPVIGGIGLKTGVISPEEDFGSPGLSWQKDTSWGNYYVTTLHDYAPGTLANALIYSDNIYFAKTALRIGADKLAKELDSLGFGQQLPFEISVTESRYSNTDRIETEIQLADSGYGQGQILVNPLHLASIYTAFLNQGNMLKPCLRYSQDEDGEIWIPDAFPQEAVDQIMEGMTGVVNDPAGTGYGARREELLLGGKTGTAELKATQEDSTGTEIGWFAVFPVEKEASRPILLISMVENVKELGGSGYVVQKDAAVLNEYFSKNRVVN